MPPMQLADARDANGDLWFFSTDALYRATPQEKKVCAVAMNPSPAECRCLAVSPQGIVGTDTYDCGFVFTYDLARNQSTSHGRVWLDDHRANFGPAAFAGSSGEYFLANHGEAEIVVGLWVTSLADNRHWRIGEAAVQLVRAQDGKVWGTQGRNPPVIAFDPDECWIAAWQSQPGKLFCYSPGAKIVELLPEMGEVGCLAELPNVESPSGTITVSSHLLLTTQNELRLFDTTKHTIQQKQTVLAPVIAATTDYKNGAIYMVLEGGAVYKVSADNQAVNEVAIKNCNAILGNIDRGFFILPDSSRLVGIARDGTTSIFDPRTDTVATLPGPVPTAAGPAVDVNSDTWYFAARELIAYSIKE